MIVQTPAKPNKKKFKDEDYSTPYQPPVLVPEPDPEPVPDPASEAAAAVSEEPNASDLAPLCAVPGLDDIVIEDGVPVPPMRNQGGRTAQMRALLTKLKPGQSARLSMRFHAVLAHTQTRAHKAKQGTFTVRTDRKTDMLRVWRVS
jgi:hypothetical protein